MSNMSRIQYKVFKGPYRVMIFIIAMWAFLFSGPALGEARAAYDFLRPLAAGENAAATLGQPEAYDYYQEWFSSIGEDLYYQVRYFMKEIAGVSFNDFDMDDFINEAVAAGYEALAESGGKKMPDSGFYSNIRTRIFQMVAITKGCEKRSLNIVVAKVHVFISAPPKNLSDNLVLSRSEILSYLKKEEPSFENLVSDIRHNAVGQYEHSKRAQRAFAEGRVAAPSAISTTEMPYYGEEAVDLKDVRKKILVVLKELSYREREIIKLRYGLMDGYCCTLKEVGEIFKLNKERIRQLEARAIWKLQQSEGAADLEAFYGAFTKEMAGRQIKALEGCRDLVRAILREVPAGLPGAADIHLRRAQLTRSEEDRLVAWFESRLPVDNTQRKIAPYVLQGLSSEEIARVLRGPQGKDSQWERDEKRRLMAKLRLWFTMGLLREYGSANQVRQQLIRLLSETPQERKIRREEEDIAMLQFSI